MPRALWVLLPAAALLRAWACLATEVPGRDGVTYLWMAQQLARGDVQGFLSTVFHPLYPALVAPLLAWFPSLDPVAAGQLVAAGCGTLALVPLAAMAGALHGPRIAAWTAALYACGTWYCRHPAECMSEGPFYLATATWAWALLACRRQAAGAALAGAMGACAWLARPEGAALVVLGAAWLGVRGRRTDAARLMVVALPLCALLPASLALAGHGFVLTPKAAFVYAEGVGGAMQPHWHWLVELAQVPLALGESMGFVAFPLFLAGAWLVRPRALRDPAALLLAPLLVQCLVAPGLFAHHRFFTAQCMLLLPFAAVALVRLLAVPRLRLLAGLVLAALVTSEVRVLVPRNTGRSVERELGEHLAAQLRPGDQVATDMPRLAFFAGRKPPPPRAFTAEDLEAALADPRCTHLALVRGRGGIDVDPVSLAGRGFEPMILPSGLAAAAEARGVLVFSRTTPR